MSVLHSQPKHRNYTNITPNYGPGAVVSGYGGSAMPGRSGGPQPPSMQYPSVGMSGGAMPPVPGPGPATGPVPGFTAGPMPGFMGGPMGGPTGGPMPPGGYPPQYPGGGMQPGVPPYMQGSMPGNRGMGGGVPQAVPPQAQHRQPSQQHGGYGGGGSGAMGQQLIAQTPQPAAQMYGYPQHPGMQPPMYPPGTGAGQPTAMPYASAYMPQAGAYTGYPVASGMAQRSAVVTCSALTGLVECCCVCCRWSDVDAGTCSRDGRNVRAVPRHEWCGATVSNWSVRLPTGTVRGALHRPGAAAAHGTNASALRRAVRTVQASRGSVTTAPGGPLGSRFVRSAFRITRKSVCLTANLLRSCVLCAVVGVGAVLQFV
jgi:hypothetical protein